MWVATTICTLESVKKRTKAIGKFLEVSGHLVAMGNLNGVFEVLAGLHHGAVFRLKQSWEGISSQHRKTYEEVKKITDRSMSYSSLRQFIKKLNPPCIPYLGMYLTDLTFIEEGNKDFLNNLINWNKRHLISETIRQIRQYQLQAYIFTVVPWLRDNLSGFTNLIEDELYELSEWLEVRLGKERGPKPQKLIDAQRAQDAAAAALTASQASSSASSTATVGRNSAMASSFKSAASAVPDSVALEQGHSWPFYEPDTPQNVEVDSVTNTVRSGTLTKLVERLTHNAVNPDSNSLYGFLVMYRSLTDANSIMDLLIQRWNVPPPKDKSTTTSYNDTMVTPIHLRVCNFLKTWIDRHYSDFDTNPELKQRLRNFITSSVQPSNEGFAKMLNIALTKQETAIAALANPNLDAAPAPILPPAHITNPSFYDLNPEEFARQLCIVHHRAFAAIRADELLDQAYRSLDKEARARNVVALQAHSQSLFSFTKNELASADALGNPGAAAGRFLEIVSRLVAHQNLIAARTIIEAIDSVVRTKPHLLDNVSVDARNTFNDSKDSLITRASSKVSFPPPMVLPMQVFFNDLTSSELAIGQPLPDKRINFEKRLAVAETITRFMSYQKQTYVFHEVPIYTQFFIANRVISAGTASTSSPGNTFGAPRASTTGSVGEAPGGASTYGFFMVDLVVHDDEIKHEIQGITTEIYRMNVALIQEEIQQLIAGSKAPGTKLALSAPAPTAAMPVYVPPAAAPAGLVNPAFSTALGTSAASNATPVVGTPPTGAPLSTGMFPANFGNPGLAKTASPIVFQSAFGSSSLGPNFTNPGLANPAFVGSPSSGSLRSGTPVGNTVAPVASPATPVSPNPAFVNPALANPAFVPIGTLAGSNPAVGTNPALTGSNPALTGSNTSLSGSNPSIPAPTALVTPTAGFTPNPALVGSSNALSSSGGSSASGLGASNPALPGSPAPTSGLLGPLSNPVTPGTNRPMPPGLVQPAQPLAFGQNNLGQGSGLLGQNTAPFGQNNGAFGQNNAQNGQLGQLGQSNGAYGQNGQGNFGQSNGAFGQPNTFNALGVPQKSGSGSIDAVPTTASTISEIPVHSMPPTGANSLTSSAKAGLKFPLPAGPAGALKRPISPSASLGSVGGAGGFAVGPPSNAPPPTPAGGLQRSASGQVVGVSNVETPGVPSGSPPQTPTSAGGSSIPGSAASSGTLSKSNSGEIPTSTTPTPDSILNANNSGSNNSLGSSAPLSPSVGADGEVKKLPLPAPAKSRASFTSASKQASVRDLIAGLGKMSPSTSNPALRGPNPLAGSGSFAAPGSPTTAASTAPIVGTPPGTPSRSSSNSSLNGDMTSSVGPMGSSLGPMGNSLGPMGNSLGPMTSSLGSNPGGFAVAAPVAAPAPVVSSDAQLRALASQQLSADFPAAALTQWSAVEPGTNQTLTCDLLKSDRASYVCSINTTITPNDINNLVRVGKLFKQQNPSLPLACIVLTFNIDAAANELAGRYKMKVYQFNAE